MRRRTDRLSFFVRLLLPILRLPILLLPLLLAGCSAVIPWEKVEGDDNTLTWTGPDQRAIWWWKQWHCYSASGICSDSKTTDHRGRALNFNDSAVADYFIRYYFEEMLYWGFVETMGLHTAEEQLAEKLVVWHRTYRMNSIYWNVLPHDGYAVSLDPHIILMVENRYHESRKEAHVLEHQGSLFTTREAFYAFFLQQTPERERTFATYSRNNPKTLSNMSRGGALATEFEIENRIQYLETRGNKQFGRIKLDNSLPDIWLIDMRTPNQPPKLLPDLDKRTYQHPIGEGEVLDIWCKGGKCKTHRYRTEA